MSNRCPNCEKFVSLEPDEPECDSVEVDSEGNVNATVTLNVNCADCGGEMKTAELEFNLDVSEALGDHKDAVAAEAREKAKAAFVNELGLVSEEELDEEQRNRLEELQDAADTAAREECELEVECIEISAGERITDAKLSRFRKKFYVVDAVFEVSCNKHEWSTTVGDSEEVQASSMEDLN